MTIFAGDRRRKAYALALEAADDDVDFTEVSSWEMRVRLPTGGHSTWAAFASQVTESSAVLTHVFADDGSDLPVAGPYDVIAWLTFADGGALQSDPVTVFVQDPYAVRV